MKEKVLKKERLWRKQNDALRNPSEIFGSPFGSAGITKDSLKFKATDSFIKLIHRLGITLIISREYENLLISLAPENKKLKQGFFHLPHPSGIAIDRRSRRVYVAATRNPNQIIEFKPAKNVLKHSSAHKNKNKKYLMPTRAKFFSGSYYFHELAFIGKHLYGNAVGLNSVVKININNGAQDKPIWWPKCVEDAKGKPRSEVNYIQLNSIAAGETIAGSFFSASSESIRGKRPGDPNYPVKGKGVIFSGKNRKVFCRGLTRPHSARLYKNKVLVNNSGYGEIGGITKGKFVPYVSLPGWTRGLCVIGNIALVGVSRILPRFKSYAPGLKGLDGECSVYAVNLETKKIVGSVNFPNGNQIFAIESMPSKITSGFFYENIPQNNSDREKESDFFYRYQI
jgi:uncharacterized protein (TIGR03032 family)